MMSKKKKILFVINSMMCGGAEKSLISLLPLIDYSKYSVDLQLFRKYGEFLELIPKKVNILDDISYFDFLKKGFKEKLLYPKKSYFLSYIRNSIGIRFNKKNHPTEIFWNACHNSIDKNPKKYDVAIAWGQGNPTHYVAEKVNADKKIAWINADYVKTGHNMDFDKKYYDDYDNIVAVSYELKTMLLEQFPFLSDKLSVILDIQNADLILKMASFGVEKIKKEKNELIIVTVGRMVQLKGYDLAVDAARQLKENKVKFKWYFIGDGPEKENIFNQINKNKLENSIILTGAKSNPYPYIQNADIYVQTSRQEGYCLTLAEARILNKPIVTTNFDVVHEQIADGENGLIVDIDAKSIADGIIRLLKDDKLRKKLVCNLSNEKKGNIEEFKKFESLLEGD